MKLKNRTIVIVGGGRGIGRTIAMACAREGAKTVIAARSMSELQETATKIRETIPQAKILTLHCDVTSDEQVTELFSKAENQFGPIDGLVCVAGIYGPISPLEETSIQQWSETIQINLIGTVRCIMGVVKGMKQRKSGRIILFAGGGQEAMPNFSAYVSSKGGILRLTETLGAELAPFNIFVNAISPGAVNTLLLDQLLAAGPEKAGEKFYQKSLEQKEKGGAPAEKSAGLAIYLLSEESRGLHGKNLSAIWDKYSEIQDPAELSKSDIYTMKRVTDLKGGTRN